MNTPDEPGSPRNFNAKREAALNSIQFNTCSEQAKYEESVEG
jgi:hypothetical protein